MKLKQFNCKKTHQHCKKSSKCEKMNNSGTKFKLLTK